MVIFRFSRDFPQGDHVRFLFWFGMFLFPVIIESLVIRRDYWLDSLDFSDRWYFPKYVSAFTAYGFPRNAIKTMTKSVQ